MQDGRDRTLGPKECSNQIATVLINSRCPPSISTQKVSRSCLKNVAQSPHRDEHHVTASSVQFPAIEVALFVPIHFVFSTLRPLFSQCHMETLHLLQHRCCAATKRCLRRHRFNVFQEERQRLWRHVWKTRDLPSACHHSQFPCHSRCQAHLQFHPRGPRILLLHTLTSQRKSTKSDKESAVDTQSVDPFQFDHHEFHNLVRFSSKQSKLRRMFRSSLPCSHETLQRSARGSDLE